MCGRAPLSTGEGLGVRRRNHERQVIFQPTASAVGFRSIHCYPEGNAFKYEIVVHAAPQGRTFNNRDQKDRHYSPAGADYSKMQECNQ